jgi:uncharacterized membrane protein YidH (DUF202 family)
VSLANERTYLAWVRTSLSTISFGVGKNSFHIQDMFPKKKYKTDTYILAITQLFKLDKSILKDPSMADEMSAIGKPLGMSFVVIGMFYMVFAFIRYFHSQVAMTKGYFPASRGIVILTTGSTLVALIAIFAVIIQKG